MSASKWTAGGRGLATAASGNLVSLRSTANQRAHLHELYVVSEAATIFQPALYLTTVVDTAGSGLVPQKLHSGSGPAQCSIVTIPTGGTKATVAVGRAYLPAIAGSAWVWTWDEVGLEIPLGLSLMVVNDIASAGPAITWQATWSED